MEGARVNLRQKGVEFGHVDQTSSLTFKVNKSQGSHTITEIHTHLYCGNSRHTYNLTSSAARQTQLGYGSGFAESYATVSVHFMINPLLQHVTGEEG